MLGLIGRRALAWRSSKPTIPHSVRFPTEGDNDGRRRRRTTSQRKIYKLKRKRLLTTAISLA